MWRCLGHTELVMVELVISSLVALICTMRHALMRALSLERNVAYLFLPPLQSMVLSFSIFSERPEGSGSGQSKGAAESCMLWATEWINVPFWGCIVGRGGGKLCMDTIQFSWNLEVKGCRNIGVAWFWCNWRTGEVRILTTGDVPAEQNCAEILFWVVNSKILVHIMSIMCLAKN